MAHGYNVILLSHKKNEIMPFVAMLMDLEMILLNEASQKAKTNTISCHLYVELKFGTNALIDKTES